ncbi:P-loop containing nucleoside triphosphate hydrolase protein [Dentipellis sp. KUC8613]|nr:P-loop containing nucleoside triphosphate hydrolase protein [Dentipellis sp. KUC8613]
MQTTFTSISGRCFRHTRYLRLSRYYATVTPRLQSVNNGVHSKEPQPDSDAGAVDLQPDGRSKDPHQLQASLDSQAGFIPPGWTVSGPETDNRGPPVQPKPAGPSRIPPKDVMGFLRSRVANWCRSSQVIRRLHGFGVQATEIEALLQSWKRATVAGASLGDKSYSPHDLARLSERISSAHPDQYIDQALTTAFLSWIDTSSRASKRTLFHIRNLRAAVDLTRITDMFPVARTMRRRVVMHVGPTNSGKTHNALRALAASPTGAYAGPLRLLAHEIQERLSSGQIVPLGVDPSSLPESIPPDEDSNLDAASTDGAIRKLGDPRFARECSLMTGEERRLVEHAGLMSCTIEMLDLDKLYDVLVVDEIQMLADSERGYSWTGAVLGAAARELHLCGEEAAVPLVESLIAMTGDELIVNRYERLSPLQVADESLYGDIKKIQKGDCVVAFSRSSIFALKERIENETGLRCALVYGRLPPEIRSEQAALFNDPDSGYDVLIGSDAVGMGLNLKIRRVIFDQLNKFDGNDHKALSHAQVKQIAGRAGRFGLHKDMRETGVVTTLNAADLPYLREAMDAPAKPLRYARVGWFVKLFEAIIESLPRNASATDALDALTYASRLPPMLTIMDTDSTTRVLKELLDEIVHDMPLTDRQVLLQTPVAYRDIVARKAALQMLRAFRDRNRVDLRRILEQEGLLQVLEKVLSHKATGEAMFAFSSPLHGLETLHRVLIIYIWLYMHRPVAFYAYNQAIALKEATEKCMEWLLSMRAKAREDAKNRHQKIGYRGPPTGFTRPNLSRPRAHGVELVCDLQTSVRRD